MHHLDPHLYPPLAYTHRSCAIHNQPAISHVHWSRCRCCRRRRWMMRRRSIDNDAKRALDDVCAGVGHEQYQHHCPTFLLHVIASPAMSSLDRRVSRRLPLRLSPSLSTRYDIEITMVQGRGEEERRWTGGGDIIAKYME